MKDMENNINERDVVSASEDTTGMALEKNNGEINVKDEEKKDMDNKRRK